MNEITRINHFGVRVRDFERARDFYAKLGFKYVAGPSGPEPVAIVVHPSGINLSFILNANQEDRHNILMDDAIKYSGYTHIALEITDATKVINDLESMDIQLSGAPVDHPTGTSFFIRDPDHNVIEFIQYTGLSKLTQA